MPRQSDKSRKTAELLKRAKKKERSTGQVWLRSVGGADFSQAFDVRHVDTEVLGTANVKVKVVFRQEDIVSAEYPGVLQSTSTFRDP